MLMRSGKVLKRHSDKGGFWKGVALWAAEAPALSSDVATHTLPCSERQETNRGLLARIPWKLRLGRREQRQERKGPLILRGAAGFAALSKLPTAVFLPAQ